MALWPPHIDGPPRPLGGSKSFFCQIASSCIPLPKKGQKSAKIADLELLVPSPNKLNHSAVWSSSNS